VPVARGARETKRKSSNSPAVEVDGEVEPERAAHTRIERVSEEKEEKGVGEVEEVEEMPEREEKRPEEESLSCAHPNTEPAGTGGQAQA
jgi:hypothetical protein